MFCTYASADLTVTYVNFPFTTGIIAYDSVTESGIGSHLGTISVAAPTCADDILILANSECELQIATLPDFSFSSILIEFFSFREMPRCFVHVLLLTLQSPMLTFLSLLVL
jgi:hypothetical protein